LGIDPSQSGQIAAIWDFCYSISNRNCRNHIARTHTSSGEKTIFHRHFPHGTFIIGDSAGMCSTEPLKFYNVFNRILPIRYVWMTAELSVCFGADCSNSHQICRTLLIL